MKVVCPQCNATYDFPESRLPDRRAFFSCKRCNKRIALEPKPSVGKNWDSITASEEIWPTAPPKTSKHNSALLSELPEAGNFAPEKYALDQLVPPNKKGKYKTRLNKLKLKLLGAVQEPLDQLLDQDEQVFHVAAATAYYPLEIFFGNGWLTMMYNRYVLVGTNKRLVAINTNYKINRPTHYLYQFPYQATSKVKRGLFGTSLILTPIKGKRRTFTGMKRALAAELKNAMTSKIDPTVKVKPNALPPVNLCPACYTGLTDKLTACSKCHATFKSPLKAALRSLLLPGWGDIYLGHRFLGFFELLGSVIVWGFCATLLLEGQPENLVMGIGLLLFVNGMDSLLTLRMARKGYSLEKKQSRTAPVGRLSASRA
jgi:hypothetical protein